MTDYTKIENEPRDYTHFCALPNTEVLVKNLVDPHGVIHLDVINPATGQQVKITGYPEAMHTIIARLAESIDGRPCAGCLELETALEDARQQREMKLKARAQRDRAGRLVSAAPDMLLALQEARDMLAYLLGRAPHQWFGTEEQIAQHTVIASIDTAIKKATAEGQVA